MRLFTLLNVFFICTSLSLCSLDAYSQEDSTRTISISGKEYFIHRVVKGNTLYSLSKAYGVSVEDIVKENPSAKDGLSLGQELRIPKPDKREEEKRKIELDGNYLVHEITAKQTLYSIAKMYNIDIKELIAENPNTVYGVKDGDLLRIPIDKMKKEEVAAVDITKDRYPDHLVKTGETLYSLSKQYQVSISSIEEVNNGLAEGLKVGQLINIPISSRDDELRPGLKSDSLKLKKQYNIALFLPLFLQMNDSLGDVRTPDSEDEIYGGKNTAAAMKFYQGLVMALDSCAKLGFSANLHVFDTENDSVVVNKIIRKPSFKAMDLIIGPLYPELFNSVLEVAEKRKISIISPINPSNRQLLGNEHLIKLVTSKSSQVADLAKYLTAHYSRQNVVVLKKDFMDNSLADLFMDNYLEQLTFMDDPTMLSPVKEFSCNSSTTADNLTSVLVADSQNIVFLPSIEKVFVSDVIRKLYSLKTKYKITLIGMEEWLKFDNLDLNYFEELNLHVISWNYIDYENPKTLKVIEAYYRKYNSFCSDFGLKAFDIGMYFFPLMQKYGNSFPYFLESHPAAMSAHYFRFCQTGIESGFENQSLVILRFKDYKLQKVN